MNLTKCVIANLFGHFTYTIEFNKSVTLIHGLNGCGKTTILKMIDALFNSRTDILRGIEFSEMSVYFDDDSAITIIRKEHTLNSPRILDKYWTLDFKLFKNGNVQSFSDENDHIDPDRFYRHSGLPPYIKMVSDNQWRDSRRGLIYSTEELIDNYGPRIMRMIEEESYIPHEMEEILQSIKVTFISSDRLTVQKRVERSYGDDTIKVEQRVDDIAKSLAELMGKAIQKYAQISQSKDQTFPMRAIHEPNPMPIEQIRERLAVLEQKRKELIDNGILEEEHYIDIGEILESIAEKDRSILSLYTVDTEEKLNVLAEVSTQINLFRKIIETNFSGKKMVFSQKEGFYFESIFDGRKIKASSLSSGEQHELVMFYDLIFETHNNSTVLIDEPELSLHIKWQLDFIAELQEIIRLSSFQVIIATHSPQIIHDNWDITVSLSSGDHT